MEDFGRIWDIAASAAVIFFTGAVTWVVTTAIDLKTRVAVLTARPYVDPIKHASEMTAMSAALSSMANTVAELAKSHNDRHRELKEEMDEIKAVQQDILDEIRSK